MLDSLVDDERRKQLRDAVAKGKPIEFRRSKPQGEELRQARQEAEDDVDSGVDAGPDGGDTDGVTDGGPDADIDDDVTDGGVIDDGPEEDGGVTDGGTDAGPDADIDGDIVRDGGTGDDGISTPDAGGYEVTYGAGRQERDEEGMGPVKNGIKKPEDDTLASEDSVIINLSRADGTQIRTVSGRIGEEQKIDVDGKVIVVTPQSHGRALVDFSVEEKKE